MPEKKQSFEQALAALEKLVAGLESGEMTLEEAIKAFETGNKLVKACRAHLADAENRVEKISATGGAQAADGSPQTVPFDE